ncbi:MAG: DUF4349 domain-containing protein [Bacillota bacterium]
MFQKFKFSKLILLVSLILLLFVVGCQGNQTMNQQAQVKESSQMKNRTSQFTNSKANKAPTTQADNYGSEEQATVDRKVIKEANLKIISKDLTTISEEITTIVENSSGYLANSNQWQSDRKYYKFSIKVPQKKFHKAINDLEQLGEVNNKQISSRDITMEYIDLQARLKNFKAQEERYINLLEQAKDVEDILKIEKELNRVRRNIEQLQGKLDYYDNKINFSTINVTFTTSKPVIDNNNWGFLDSFKDSIQEFVNSINSIIVIVGALLPWLALIAVIAFIIYKLYCYYRQQK